jgi:hypothetical protein
MSSAEPLTTLKAELLQALVPQVLDVLARALREGTPSIRSRPTSGIWPCNSAAAAWPPSSPPAAAVIWARP